MKRLALLFVTSCAWFSTTSETATRDMRLYVTIGSSDAGTHVTADLSGPLDSVELGPNDTLAMLVDGAPVVSARVTSFDLEMAARSGTFTFALHHEGDHDVAVDVTLVPPSDIRATSSGGKLVLDWTPHPKGGGPIITVTGTCIHAQTIQIQTDVGHYELLAAQLQTLPSSCPIAVAFTRDLQLQIPFLGATFLYATISQSESAEGTWTP